MMFQQLLINSVGVLVIATLLAILIIVIIEAWQHQKLKREPMSASEIMYYHMTEMNDNEVIKFKKNRGK